MQYLTAEQLRKLKLLIWGDKISEEIFSNWSQGFEWSPSEPCALIQHRGGPCAVIAPVQAYFLKNLFFSDDKSADLLPIIARQDISSLSEVDKQNIFVKSLWDMFFQMNPLSWLVCSIENVDPENASTSNLDLISPRQEMAADIPLSVRDFHNSLKLRSCTCKKDLIDALENNTERFGSQYGVLLFLYSAILSKGIENILNEMDDPELSLIDSIQGHGSQNLINMMICGEAVANVFDGDRDLAGLSLRGINVPCQVGFLTLLERMRYCTVGDALKHPEFPIWLLGSETHVSVFFSLETSLVAPESARERAEKVFDKFDPEDNGFIATAFLEEILSELDLVCDPEYAKIMAQNMDPEELGIIIRSKFIEEFFGSQDSPRLPDSFSIYHYNGLVQSSYDHQVRFRKGVARVMDWQECGSRSADSQIESCLQMRWPGLWVNWCDDEAPSLN